MDSSDLGTPRQITDGDMVEVAFHSYYPYGAEATDPLQDEVRLKFTGHERDENGSADAGVLDYMHARFCSPHIGRFLTVDPEKSMLPGRPQTWGRYAYARNNPITRLDPDGRDDVMIGFEEEFARASQMRENTGSDPIGRFIGGSLLAAVGLPLLGAAVAEVPFLATAVLHPRSSQRVIQAAEVLMEGPTPNASSLMPDPAVIRTIKTLPDNAKLTAEQIVELSKNVDRLVAKSIPKLAERNLGESVRRLIKEDPRFRFLDQVPDAKERLLLALEEFDIKPPEI